MTTKIINGRSAYAGNDKGSKEVTKKSNANDHDLYKQKHGAKGINKSKGNDNMQDNNINTSEKKTQMVGLILKKGSL